MRSRPDRGVLTNFLATYLTAEGFKVGKGIAPLGAGWQSDPGLDGSEFIPYVVITPMNAAAPTGVLADSSCDWRLPYTLSTYGVDHTQVEDHADDVGKTMANLRRVELTMRDGNGTWQIQQVTWTSLGGVGVATAIDPTAYSQSDSALVWLSKNL